MKGRLNKTPNGWVIGGTLYNGIWSNYIPLNPNQQGFNLKEGSEVEYKEETYWETGLDPFKVATLDVPFVSDDFQIGPDGAYEHTEIDEFHHHEFLDRVSLMGDIVDHTLLKHPVCDDDEEIKNLTEEIISKLVDLYQKAGEIRFKDEEGVEVSESNNLDMKKSLGEIGKTVIERSVEIKYKYADISDLGNELGVIVGNFIKDMTESQTKDFIHGIRHGISLTNGTH
jgi:hypothetical protein